MPWTVSRGFGFSTSRLPLPTVRVVRTDKGPRWAALTEEMKLYYKRLAGDAIDAFANRVAGRSLAEVPKGPRAGDDSAAREHGGEFEAGSLAGSIRYPGNDPAMRCDPASDYFSAAIEYDTEYAVAQHEGIAVMIHHHPVIPGAQGFFERTDVEQDIEIVWEVKNYTTPGTKSHYLSDPFKAAIPFMEDSVGRYIRDRLL